MNDLQLFWLGILAIASSFGLGLWLLFQWDCRRERKF